jgi:Uma2 family endonuclease
LRIRIREGKYRIPDVTVLDRAGEKEQVVTRSPLAVFEVLSPDDLAAELFEKLEDYSSIRIRDVWVVDPKTETFRRYIEGCLEPALLFESPERGIVFEMSEIRAYLQD